MRNTMAARIYPLDMMNSTEYGNSYVLFKASTWNDSQSKNPAAGSSNSAVPSPSNTTSGALVSGSSSSSASGIINPITSPITDVTEKFKGSKLGALVPPVKAVDDYVQLYIPKDLAISYNAIWEEQNFPVAGHLFDAAVGVASGATGQNIWDKLGAGVAAGLTQAAQNAVPGADYFMSLGGKAPNPKKTMLFKDMAFREFQFTYEFFVKNANEAEAVREIILTFKKNMHPGVPEGAAFLYDYPSEFDITYYANNEKSLYLHKHKRCVLIAMDVKYTPQGLWVSHEDGSYTSVVMVLRFKEVEILTRQDFEKNDEDTKLQFPTY